MIRRKFLRTLSAGLGATYAVPLTTLSCKTVSQNESKPKIWVWLRPMKDYTSEQYRELFKKMHDSGVDAILPEIYNSWGAHFKSTRHKVLSNWLEEIMPAANDQNLEVHGWMWSMPNNQDKYVQDYKEWYVVNAKGESAATKPAYVDYYRFMCPNNPEVRSFVKDNVNEIASIKGLAGVHLDYIRLPDVILPIALQPKYNIVQREELPEYDYCYCDICVDTFKQQTGINIRAVDNPSQNQEWRIFRQNSITKLVNDYLLPAARQQDKMISAAVFPNWENVHQNWYKWDIDAFMPMLYSKFYDEGNNWLADQTKKGMASVRPQQKIYSGLFVSSYSGKELKPAIHAALQAGAAGIALFDVKGLNENHFHSLKKF